jgi:uncharacterized protein (DUF305 family)
VLAAASIAAVACFALIRRQIAVHDRQFLESMIPHHASAILMCERAKLGDSENRALCASIVEGQRREIEQMQAKLDASTAVPH